MEIGRRQVLLTQLVTDHCRDQGIQFTRNLNVKPSEWCGPESEFHYWRSLQRAFLT